MNIYESDIFEKEINSESKSANDLLCNALFFFSRIKKNGLAASVDEFSFRLAVDEAVTNSISHGNAFNSEKRVQVTIIPKSEKIEIIVEDEGTGFDPASVKNPLSSENRHRNGGRGIYLLQKIGTVRWNKRGNRIHIVLQ